ncbi:MAG: phenylacetate--CoA ligase [Deltaproteobacteria bacterium]|nr:MAG: phenylacetate--CoA ligase [Deltaproteobacteria bacterium]
MNYWNEKFETMGVEEMRAFQDENLAATVAWLYERVPFYTKALDEKGVKPAYIKGVDDLSKLPFTVKTDLRDNYPLGLCAVPVNELARIHASSGTTGKPITGPYTKEDRDQWAECMARTLYAQGVRKGDVIQNAYGMGLFTGGLGFLLGAENIGCCVVPSGSGMTDRQIMLMQDLNTKALFATPSYTLTIAERAEKMGVDIRKLPLEIASCGAEPWTLEMKADIERRMGIVAHEAYGLTEMMGPGVAFSCSEGKLHINEDHILPEIVDPDTLEQLPVGEQGELVFTAIQRRAMPLLRYRTRDITRLVREKCACGRTLITMEKILGRSDDMLIISGVNIFPSQIESVILDMGDYEPLYQLRVTKKGYLDKIKVEVEAKPEFYEGGADALAQMAGKLKAKLNSVIGIGMDIEILPIGTIPRSEGKAKRVFDER